MRYLLTLALFIFVLFGLSTDLASAEPTPFYDYTPLAELPGTTRPGTGAVNAATYIPGIIKLTIGVAGALSVLMIIFGGIQYMSTDAISGKSDAKERIQNAIYGLVLAIGSYTILYTINPNFVKIDLGLTRYAPPVIENTAGQIGQPWPEDDGNRAILRANTIGINNSNCVSIGDKNCTSVYGMSSRIINALIRLKEACPTCLLTITGGTEYWLHSEGTQHRPGGRVVDLRLDSQLFNFLEKNGFKSEGTGCTTGSQRFVYDGGTYVNETIAGNSPHWHVCF
ncbi:MAG: hypothetical protein AB200_02305 [Parcubacteria bacterium C7867-005]|nr:MAG: hypothetical protein AB200_02305 [Parcubacteria bacterium C7867-005]